MQVIKTLDFIDIVDCGDRFSVVSVVENERRLLAEYWKNIDEEVALEAAIDEAQNIVKVSKKIIEKLPSGEIE